MALCVDRHGRRFAAASVRNSTARPPLQHLLQHGQGSHGLHCACNASSHPRFTLDKRSGCFAPQSLHFAVRGKNFDEVLCRDDSNRIPLYTYTLFFFFNLRVFIKE